jgi:predicted house-cleaning noncanonical NTP pyrophosphatase (MazG superfamily)
MSGERYTTKLVRDRIPEIAKNKGEAVVTRVADESEFKDALLIKLHEEVSELVHGGRTDEEIADILEVLQTIARERGVSWQRILHYQRGKRITKGGFDARIMMKVPLNS